MTAQAVSEAGAFSRVGSSGTIGMTRVCISETTIPARASTATTAFDLGGAGVPAAAGRVRASDMGAGLHRAGSMSEVVTA
ncbi:hypothetical protein GCM10011578_061400 [Streptomyces fuscichromogenes]|uniref:Uncharacterized protein n=1 Tax=Streptomyces fuscichromogenes TaxID=1324013 RepID=A0A917XHK3_9ACTN|nr:hypothetical protein GCM10011578_061400 [Streptomyces fuscichromogenes]